MRQSKWEYVNFLLMLKQKTRQETKNEIKDKKTSPNGRMMHILLWKTTVKITTEENSHKLYHPFDCGE